MRRGEQPMFTGYVGALLAWLGALWWIAAGPTHREASFVAGLGWGLVLYAILLVAIDYLVRYEELRAWRREPLPWPRRWRAALVRWFGWLAILFVGYALYGGLAHYRTEWYRWFRTAYRALLLGWVLLGVPYYLFALRRRWGLHWDRKDPGLLVAIAGRRLLRSLRAGRAPWRGLAPLWRSPTARLAWRGLVVKGFFLPIMFTFLVLNVRDLAQVIHQAGRLHLSFPDWPPFLLYRFAYASLFTIDVALATVGYAVTTRLLDNGMRSVEPTALGWAVCLACYRPFNDVTTWYFPWPPTSLAALPDGMLKNAAMLTVILLLSIYVWATLAFGVRFSNLTHRGIFTRGPYRFVRHPAYIAKNLSWWIEYLPSFRDPWAIVGMLGWNLVYFLRALTEERHLRSVDPAYERYCEHVRWRFLPFLY